MAKNSFKCSSLFGEPHTHTHHISVCNYLKQKDKYTRLINFKSVLKCSFFDRERQSGRSLNTLKIKNKGDSGSSLFFYVN